VVLDPISQHEAELRAAISDKEQSQYLMMIHLGTASFPATVSTPTRRSPPNESTPLSPVDTFMAELRVPKARQQQPTDSH
jgi:hypothetical protein